MSKKKRFKRSSWLTCCKKNSSSTTLVSDVDSVSVSQTSRQTCQTVVGSYTSPQCQACRHEEKKSRRKSLLKFWQRAESPRLPEPTAQRNEVELIDIISGPTISNTVADASIHEATREKKEGSSVPERRQSGSEGKWLKTNAQPSPLTSGSYVAIDVRDFIQKINTTHPEDPVEVVKSKKKCTKTNGQVSKDASVECQHLKDVSATRKDSVQNVRSVILSRSDGDEVIPVVAEASQTSAQRIFYIDEGSRVNRLKIPCHNEDMVQDNKAGHEDSERPESLLFTASDHMMHRKPGRSPRGPKRIVKKVVEDIQTKHIQGISDTEVKFKKKKTPIVRHVSQAAQTIVSNINIVEDKSQSKESIRSKYKRELTVKQPEANHDKTTVQRDGDNVVTEHEYRPRDTDALSFKIPPENSEIKKYCTSEFHTSKVNAGKPQPDNIIVTRNSTCPDLQCHTRQSRQDTPDTYLYMPIRRYDCGFQTHVYSTKDNVCKLETHNDYNTVTGSDADHGRGSVLQTDSQNPNTRYDVEVVETITNTLEQNENRYKIQKTEPEITPVKPKRRPYTIEQIDNLDQQAYQMEVQKCNQEMMLESKVNNQSFDKRTESALSKRRTDGTVTEIVKKIPNGRITDKVVRNSRQQTESDAKPKQLRANRRRFCDDQNAREHTTTDNDISKYENHEFRHVRHKIGADEQSLLTETHTNRQNMDCRHEYTYASRSDLYADRDKLVQFKQETHAADSMGVRNVGHFKSRPHTTKSDTDKATGLAVYQTDPPTRPKHLGRVDQEDNRNTHFGHVFAPMQPAMATWYRSYVGESGELFANSDIEPEAIRLGAGLLQASARLVNRTLIGEENPNNDEPAQEEELAQYKKPKEMRNLAEAACSNGSADEEQLMSLGFTKKQVTQALKANDNDVCSAAEWLFSGSDIDSTDSPRTRARHAREAHAKLALHAPLDLIPEDIQEFYNKKKVPPTNKEEYERDLALALLEVEPVPVTESGSDIMGEGNLEQVNSVGAFYSTCDASPCVKHGKHRTDGDGAEDTTDDDRTETSATSGSRTEDETGSGHKDIGNKTQTEADDSLQSQKSSRQSNVGEKQGADQGQGCYLM